MIASAFVLLLAAAHEPSLSRFNYREHVRPIFLRHCAGCHRPDGAGPMSLLDYQEAVPWANAIKLALLEERMPPFLPDDGSGPFQRARVLSAKELDTLVDWSVGMTPEGEAVLEAISTPIEEGPRADRRLEAPAEVVLEEDQGAATVCLSLPTGRDRRRVAVGYEILSQSPAVLRRATLFLGRSCADAEAFGTWLPDQGRVSLPAGFGRAIPSDLALELRYVKRWEDDGKRIADRPSVALWFSDGVKPLRGQSIARPRWRVRKETLLVALYPLPGDESPLSVELVAPGVDSRLLLSIDGFDPAWSEKYFFRDPVLLVPGSEIRVSRPLVWADLAEP